jgi:hypothetical protein
MLVAILCPPQKLRVSTTQNLLVACPALQRGAREAIELEVEIRVGQDRAVESKRVGRSCARSERSVCVQGLGAAEQVAQLRIDIGASLRRPNLGTRLDGVRASLLG